MRRRRGTCRTLVLALSVLATTGCGGGEPTAAEASGLAPLAAAEPYYVRGVLALREDDADAAVFQFGRALHIHPDHARASWRRGQAQFALRNPRLALDDVTRALALAPRLAPARDTRAWILRATGRQGEALAELVAAVRAAPEQLDDWRDGTAQTRTPEAAEEHLTRMIQGNGQDVVALFKRGNLWRSRGEPERAWQDYEAAARFGPDFPLPWLARGALFLEQGRLEQAEAGFAGAVERDPELALAHELLGWSRYLAGRFEEAEADLSRAVELAADEAGSAAAGPRERRGLARFELGRSGEAERDLTEALVLDPERLLAPRAPSAWGATDAEHYARRATERRDDPLAAALAALALQREGRLEEAEAAYGSALARRPDLALARLHRAKLFEEQERAAEALADLDAALAARSDLPRAWNSRGNLRLAAGEVGPARADYEAALALAPEFVWPLRNLAGLLLEDEPARAVELLTRAVHVEPAYVAAFEDRAAAWSALGNHPAARRDLRLVGAR